MNYQVDWEILALDQAVGFLRDDPRASPPLGEHQPTRRPAAPAGIVCLRVPRSTTTAGRLVPDLLHNRRGAARDPDRSRRRLPKPGHADARSTDPVIPISAQRRDSPAHWPYSTTPVCAGTARRSYGSTYINPLAACCPNAPCGTYAPIEGSFQFCPHVPGPPTGNRSRRGPVIAQSRDRATGRSFGISHGGGPRPRQ